MRKLLLGSFVCYVLAISVFATAPHLISYQGRLTDTGGNPVVDNNYSVMFSIYDVPSGGTAIWSETQNVTTSDGLFSVLLGTVSALDPTLVLTDSLRYLGIQVGGDPELMPRTRLTSVPYSLRSDAGGGWIINASGIVSELPARKVGVGTLAPTGAQMQVVDYSNSGYAAIFDGTRAGITCRVLGSVSAPFDMTAVEGHSDNRETGSQSTGILGEASGIGYNRGGYFFATNGLNSNIGIEAESNGETGDCIGVKGVATSQTSTGSTGGYFSGDELGVDIEVGEGGVPTSRNLRAGIRSAVYGDGANSTYGITAQGLGGQTVHGVSGNAGNGTTANYGLVGTAVGILGDCIGVKGIAIGQASNSSTGGYFASDELGVDIEVGEGGVPTSRSVRAGIRSAVYGDGTASTYGITSQGSQGQYVYGVAGNAADGSIANFGLYGTAPGAALSNYGVYSSASSFSNTNYGMYAEAKNGAVNYAGYFSKGSPGAVTPAVSSIVVMENSTSGYLSILAPDAYEKGILFGEPSNNAAGGIVYNSGSVPDGLSFRTSNNSTRMVITGAGKVGIGTASPGAGLHVKGAGFPEAFGYFDTDAGAQDAGLRFYEAGVAKSHLFHNAGSNTLNLFGDGYTGISINAVGAVGIGTATPNYTLDVRGTIGNNATLYHSDRRWKEHIETLSNSLDCVRKLRGVSFDWRQKEFDEMNFPDGKQIGLIAQEVEEVVPEVVNTADDGYKSVDYAKLVSLLIEAVKEQQNQIEADHSQIEELKAQVHALVESSSNKPTSTYGQK